MRSLLIVAHGSRREASNQEVKDVVERVRQRSDLAFDDIDYAFLELAEPSVRDALACCVRRGASAVTVFPYFLAAGRRVVSDIPEAVTAFESTHPGVAVTVTQHLGASELLPQAILAVAAGPALAG